MPKFITWLLLNVTPWAVTASARVVPVATLTVAAEVMVVLPSTSRVPPPLTVSVPAKVLPAERNGPRSNVPESLTVDADW